MTAQLRAELLKLRSTRTMLALAISLVGLVLLIVLLTSLVPSEVDQADEETQYGLLGIGSLALGFAAVAGVLLVTNEYRFGTIRPTFVVTPQRTRVVLAKAAAALLAGLSLGTAGELLGFGIGRAALSARDVPIAVDGGEAVLLVAGTVAAAGLWGAIGAGLGAIVRNQVGAIVGLLAWLLVVDDLLFLLVPSFGRFAPGAAGTALTGQPTDDLLAPAAGGAVLVAWAVVLVAAGVVLTARRDVE